MPFIWLVWCGSQHRCLPFFLDINNKHRVMKNKPLGKFEAPSAGGLIIESGVMELLKLPMVMQFAMMMPQLLQVGRRL